MTDSVTRKRCDEMRKGTEVERREERERGGKGERKVKGRMEDMVGRMG